MFYCHMISKYMAGIDISKKYYSALEYFFLRTINFGKTDMQPIM